MSDMINRGGLKVFPDEVEEVLRAAPARRRRAVVGVPDDRLGEVPWAFIVATDPSSSPTSAELDELCAAAPRPVQGAGAVRADRRAAAQRGRQGAREGPRAPGDGGRRGGCRPRPAEQEFRERARGRGSSRRCPRSRPSRTTTTGRPAGPTTPQWQRRLFDAGYAGIDWPADYGGRGATPTEQLIFLEETERAGAPYVGVQLRRHAARRPDADRRGHRRAAGGAPAADPARRRGLVPGLLRAGRRLRPRLAAHPGGPRRRPLRRHRPEDLDVARPRRRLLRAARAHRPRRAQAPGHHLADHADGPARHRDPARSRTLPGVDRVQRDVPRRGAHPGRRTASAPRTTAGGSRW